MDIEFVGVIVKEIFFELERARKWGDTFASLHEAHGVMQEELEEIWEITRQRRGDRSPLALRKELIQLAAMCIKTIFSIDNMVGKPKEPRP